MGSKLPSHESKVKASFADFERADVVEASYENFENFKRNCVLLRVIF